jgi:glycosidase
MGIPGIYIHGLLGSRNDYAGVKATGRARSINRQQLDHAELQRELADPASLKAQVLGEYRRLLLTRQQQTAFHPNAAQEVLDLGPAIFAVRRHNAQTGQEIIAIHNVTAQPVTVKLPGTHRDLLGAGESKDEVKLGAYEFRWLESAR